MAYKNIWLHSHALDSWGYDIESDEMNNLEPNDYKKIRESAASYLTLRFKRYLKEPIEQRILQLTRDYLDAEGINDKFIKVFGDIVIQQDSGRKVIPCRDLPSPLPELEAMLQEVSDLSVWLYGLCRASTEKLQEINNSLYTKNSYWIDLDISAFPEEITRHFEEYIEENKRTVMSIHCEKYLFTCLPKLRDEDKCKTEEYEDCLQTLTRNIITKYDSYKLLGVF